MLDMVHQAAAAADRDPSSIDITYGDASIFGDDPLGAVQELADKGVDRVIIPSYMFLSDTTAALAAFGESVIAPAN